MMKVKPTNGIIMANLVVIGLALVACINMISVQSLYPFNNMVTNDRTPTFEWSGWSQNYELILDEDADFNSPLTFDVYGRSHTMQNELDFGSYWWKVRSGEMESEPKKFTLVSTVALSRPEKSLIVNSGNTDLLVYKGMLTGAVTLAVNETLEVGEEDNVKAEQK